MNTKILKQNRARGGSSAFTLIELLLVLVILGILAAIVVPKFVGRSKDAKIAAAKQEVSTLNTALDLYEQDNDHYPTNDEGLAVLHPKGNTRDYLNHDVVNDPWGNPYIYRNPGTHHPNGVDVFSTGPDGREGGDDDIGNW